MNPEEFDKRLSESFKNEHLPPDKRLWQNISARLDEGGKKPMWYWLLPVVIVLTIAGGWLFNLARPHNDRQTTSIHETTGQNNTPAGSASTDPVVKPVTRVPAGGTSPNSRVEGSANTGSNQSSTTSSATNVPSGSTASETSPASPSGGHPLHNRHRNGIQPASYFTPTPDPVVNMAESDIALLRMNSLVHPLVPQYELEREEMINYDFPFKNKRTYKSPYTRNPVNFDSKWFWSLGLGPQVAFNKAIVPVDSQAWVHKELWANRSKMTGNSGGFQSNLMLGYKFGKHISIEAGLQYSLHSEDIRFSLTSYDIESRDNNNKITRYDGIQLWIRVWNPSTLQYDTTFYDATRGFSLSVKNRYNIFTIPVKVNYEYNISDRTKFFAGISAGLSAITTRKATHLNLINDKETIERKAHQYTASLSAQFGFYTNFNDIGQLGIYSGFQMYTKPWELSNKQYAIRMSDLQLGISFRRPLNW